MSRHRLVRGLDLDDELADYDGGIEETDPQAGWQALPHILPVAVGGLTLYVLDLTEEDKGMMPPILESIVASSWRFYH